MLEAMLTASNKKTGPGWIKQDAKYGGMFQLSSGVMLGDTFYLVGGNFLGSTWKSELLKFNETTQKLDVVGTFSQIGQAPDAWVDRYNTINWISSYNTSNAYTWRPSDPSSVFNGGSISGFTYYRKAIVYTNNMSGAGTNRIYFFGNDTNGNLMMFDRQNLTNSVVVSNFPIHGRHPAAVLVEGKIYVFGGDGAGTPSNKATKFDPATATFAVLEPMPGPRFGAAIVAINNDTIHVIGGSDNANVTKATSTESVLEYKISTNTWRELPDKFPMKVVYSAYASNDKVAFIMGGYLNSTGDIYKLSFS